MAQYKPEDMGAAIVKTPSVNEINLRNQAATPTVAMPNLSVYTPDYGALEKSFQDILSSYDQYKQAAQTGYEAQKASLGSSLEQQLQSISTAKTENKQAFSKGQAQLAQDVFMTNRATQAAASARGLSGSGVEAMANIQNRMAAGEKISNMANEFFDAQTQLVQAEDASRTNYNNALQSLNSSLQSTMAQIMSQEASSKMNYAQTIEGLKRQVIADTNAVNQAKYEWQNAQAQLDQANNITQTMVQSVLSSALSDQEKIASLTDMGYTASEANSVLGQYKTTAKTTATAQVQQTIDNILANSGTASDVQAYINNLISSGYDINVKDLNLSGTPTPTTQTTNTTSGTFTSSFQPLITSTTSPSSSNPFGSVSVNQSNVDYGLNELMKYLAYSGTR